MSGHRVLSPAELAERGISAARGAIDRDHAEKVAEVADAKAMGSRYNAGKIPVSMVPFALTEAAGRGYQFGAKKYDRDNWRKGLDYYEILDSLIRHAGKLADPDESDFDADSGLHHADLVACNAGFLAHAVKYPAKFPGTPTPK